MLDAYEYTHTYSFNLNLVIISKADFHYTVNYALYYFHYEVEKTEV